MRRLKQKTVGDGNRERYTFRGNLKSTRHGWLRLTPAYSVRLVDELLEASRDHTPVLDPFCGTGTTLLSCAEHAVDCDTLDINPFLVWLAQTKVARYAPAHLAEARRTLDRMRRAVTRSEAAAWVPPLHQIADDLVEAFERVASAAAEPLPASRRQVFHGDARRLHEVLPRDHYGLVVTSPPYANRMSYIRELRPYMYWLKYLEARSAAGVLDWKAIGGTWGSATSNLGSWRPDPGALPLPRRLERLLAEIAEPSPILSTYVRKYFHDMDAHGASLWSVMRRGGRVRVVIGNSKFFDVVVPVEELLAEQLERAGFVKLEIQTLRKRSSKKELYEYLILAERP